MSQVGFLVMVRPIKLFDMVSGLRPIKTVDLGLRPQAVFFFLFFFLQEKSRAMKHDQTVQASEFRPLQLCLVSEKS